MALGSIQGALWGFTGWTADAAITGGVKAAERVNLSSYREKIAERQIFYKNIWRLAEPEISKLLSNRLGIDGRTFHLGNWDKTNWVRMAVNALSQLYTTFKSERVISDDKVKQDLFAAMLEDLAWKSTFKNAERMVNLCNSCVVEIIGNAWRRRPQLRVHTLDRVSIFEHPDYPNELDAAFGVAIELEQSSDGYNNAVRQFIRYQRLDDAGAAWDCAITDHSGRVIKQIAGGDLPPLPCLPLVKIDYEQGFDFFIEGNDDIIDAPLNIAFRKTDFVYAQKFSAHPQMTATGFSQSEVSSLSVGPGTIIATNNPNASVGMLTPSISWSELQTTIEHDLILWAKSRSIPPNDFRLDAPIASGIAMYMARKELYEARAENIEIYRAAEKELFQKLFQFSAWFSSYFDITNAPEWLAVDWTGEDAPRITFSMPAPELTPLEVIDMFAKEKAAGVASAEDYLITVKGMSPEEAADKAAKIKESNGMNINLGDMTGGANDANA